mgnify:CR=1 FL=1
MNKRVNRSWMVILMLLVSTTACKKEPVFTYGVNDVAITQPGAVKPHVKTDLEVISIAYSDLFGTSIPSQELDVLSLAYQSFGDKRMVIDMIILNYLNSPNVQLPTDAAMRGDVTTFVKDCYKKFFVRQPTAFEAWFVADLINKDASISPDLVYYSFMTSAEYRFY